MQNSFPFLPAGERAVRQERTGWRDQEISEKHRKWGFNCPAVDLDWLVVEYNSGQPVALIEYKHFKAKDPDLKHATYRALSALAEKAELPLLLSFYWPQSWAFYVQPINDRARRYFKSPEALSERGYVSRLYTLRNLVIERTILDGLNTELPPANYKIYGLAL